MVELADVDKLRNELQELSQQRQQVNERLRNWDARGRGRGMGPGGGPGWGPGPGTGMQQRLGEPPGSSGGGDRNAGVERNGAPGHSNNPDFRNGTGYGRDSEVRPREPPSQVALPAASPPSGPQKKLMSAIVVNGQTRMLRQQSHGSAPLAAEEAEDIGRMKRPAPSEAEQNPQAQKRARRMFGALMGTLAKASAQEEHFQASGGAAKRQEAMQRVREREREERKRAREVARQKEIAEKQAEVVKMRELRAMADVKRLEIAAAERLQHRTVLAGFAKTRAQPPLHWLPAAHTLATEAALERQQEDLALWKAAELERLAAERTTILSQRAPRLLQQEAAAGAADSETTEAGEGTATQNEDAHGVAAEGREASPEGDGGRWDAGGNAERRDADDRWQDVGAGGGEADVEAAGAAAENSSSAEADDSAGEDAMDAVDTRHDGDAAETLEDLLKD